MVSDNKDGLFQRLRVGLSKTQRLLTGSFDDLLQPDREVDEALWEELEEALILADMGVASTSQLIEKLRDRVKKEGMVNAQEIYPLLRQQIANILEPYAIPLSPEVPGEHPFVVMVIGVNGSGKTTTIGKLAHRFATQGKRVLLAAADTFRAAAVEQLEIWSQRAGVDVVKHQKGADPSAVAFDAVSAAVSRDCHLLFIDTAGRLHTKENLMAELQKVKSVIAKKLSGAPHEVLLVLDATTGQNAIAQARTFHEAVGVTGIALIKLDSTSKGGIVVAVTQELGIPLRLVGVGEGIEDLQDFSTHSFVQALFNQTT